MNDPSSTRSRNTWHAAHCWPSVVFCVFASFQLPMPAAELQSAAAAVPRGLGDVHGFGVAAALPERLGLGERLREDRGVGLDQFGVRAVDAFAQRAVGAGRPLSSPCRAGFFRRHRRGMNLARSVNAALMTAVARITGLPLVSAPAPRQDRPACPVSRVS